MKARYIFIAIVIMVSAVMIFKKKASLLAASRTHIYYKYARFGLVEKIWITQSCQKQPTTTEVSKV